MDETTFSEVYGRHQAYVRAIARRHLRDPSEADDLVQEVFLQAWRQFDRFDHTRADLQGWLAVIARSRALDRLRRRTVRQRTERALEPPAGDDGGNPWSEAEDAVYWARISTALSSLEPASRQVIDLAYHADLSQRQIAARLGETLGVVKSRLKQGLSALRDELADGRVREVTAPEDPAELALTTDVLSSALQSGRSPLPPMPSLAGLQILVVDDDGRTRDVLRAVLEHAGAVALVQPSTVDACRTLESVWPDALLADIGMPDGDGFALIRHVLHLEQTVGMRLPASGVDRSGQRVPSVPDTFGRLPRVSLQACPPERRAGGPGRRRWPSDGCPLMRRVIELLPRSALRRAPRRQPDSTPALRRAPRRQPDSTPALPAPDVEALCRQILENSQDCIKLLDRQGRLLWMNTPGARLLDLAGPPPLGAPWLDFWHGAAREAAEAALHTAMAGGTGRFTGPCATFSGRMKWWSVVVAPASPDGPLVSVSRDVTDLAAALDEQNALAAAERAARDDADRANAAKDELLAAVSHEMRTPINAVLGWAALLQRTAVEPQAVAIGRQIEEIAAQELKLVADLIDEHWLARGAAAVCQQPVALYDEVREVVAGLAPLTDAKQQSVACDFAGVAPWVMGEPQRLRQVFVNLLSNAIKFTPVGGAIAITGAYDGEHVVLRVTDSGIGIPESFLARVFERFAQEASPEVRRHGGLGLGLAIARSLVGLHGGSLRAESGGRGQGASFVVTLPLAPAAAALADPSLADPARPEPAPRLDGVTVALRMADPLAADAVGSILRQLGAAVVLPGDDRRAAAGPEHRRRRRGT